MITVDWRTAFSSFEDLASRPNLGSVAPVFAARLIPAISVSALLYDHSLSFGGEMDLIWFNSEAAFGNRVGFILNRYLTEAVAIYVAYLNSGLYQGLTSVGAEICHTSIWIFSMGSSVFIGISHFLIIMRVYTLWDRRQMIKRILTAAFCLEICLALVFSALAASQTNLLWEYIPLALKFMLGAITLFDFFIIIMTVLNALDRPHTTQADVITSLQRDGARMFVCLFVLRLTSFLISVLGNEEIFALLLIFSWSMCATVNSRIQLRVEHLRFVRHTSQPNASGWDTDAF
ncbi:hypothetical protein B0H13DRAFT_2370312 [Mycena leptocephala]|nr:hypothetical protein B0H13DRAFT_2370312 [Mycena leptocephala]